MIEMIFFLLGLIEPVVYSILYWRFWLPVAAAGIVVWSLGPILPNADITILAAIPILITGGIFGGIWQSRQR